VLVNYINDAQIKAGVPKSQAYDTTMYLLAALLVGGFICNLLVRPVNPKYAMTDEELAVERKLAHEKEQAAAVGMQGAAAGTAVSPPALVAVFWLFVGIPLAWGVYITLQNAFILFR
jgi:hypothetical protein